MNLWGTQTFTPYAPLPSAWSPQKHKEGREPQLSQTRWNLSWDSGYTVVWHREKGVY